MKTKTKHVIRGIGAKAGKGEQARERRGAAVEVGQKDIHNSGAGSCSQSETAWNKYQAKETLKGRREVYVPKEGKNERSGRNESLDGTGKLVSLEELAKRLGVSEKTVCSFVGDGMPCLRKRFGGSFVVLFRESEVRAWLARKPSAKADLPEFDEDGVATGTDRAGALLAGVVFGLMALGIIVGAVMAVMRA